MIEAEELRKFAGIDRTDFLGYPVDSLDMRDAIAFVESAISRDTSCYIAVQNANKMYLADKHPRVANVISDAALILPENAINIGMSLLGRPLKARDVGGVRLMGALLNEANKHGWAVYFIGGTKENLDKMIARLKREFPRIAIAGNRDGYFSEGENESVVQGIAATGANLLFVGMGSPKQELFIANNLDGLNVNVAIGVGGSFNVFAGVEKPAPAWSKYGLEWLYRSFQDPKKFKRYVVVNSYFIYKLLRYVFHVDRGRGTR